MRLLALLSGIAACVAALFFLITAFQWFGDPDDADDANDLQGLEAFAFTFLCLAIGLFFLDRAGVASREFVLQRRSADVEAPAGTAPGTASEYRLH